MKEKNLCGLQNFGMDYKWHGIVGWWHTADGRGRWQIVKDTVILLLIRVYVWDMDDERSKKII
jgi:hypothetical protein